MEKVRGLCRRENFERIELLLQKSALVFAPSNELSQIGHTSAPVRLLKPGRRRRPIALGRQMKR